MGILETINVPQDLRTLTDGELLVLCRDIRECLVKNVSKTGGHLSPNLGVVELTVAMHRVYDVYRDRVVFDVGHQSYVHKLLTGRWASFSTLRQLGGVSGFPKPCETPADAFIAGHASNSISVALGMARARTLTGGDYDVAALIGDGAMTGGLAYEALCDAGQSGEPLVLILNDNGMSINPNVGGLSALLAMQRVRPGYTTFKRRYREVVGKVPPLYNGIHKMKELIKDVVIAGGMVEDLGFEFIGPVDGHDLRQAENALRYAKSLKVPVLVHFITQKGRGYSPAEAAPQLYHGVGPFDPAEGVKTGAECFSTVFGSELVRLAAEDDRVVALTAAMEDGTGLTDFAAKYPKRFFDVGIAEGHAVSMAAGMAKQGLKPVFAVYSSFLQRSYDMLVHDVSLQKLHVVLAVDRAGLVGRDGETHQGVFDVSFLGSVPGMTVLCPSSYAELRQMLRRAVLEMDGPVAVRYPKGGEGAFTGVTDGDFSVVREGGDISLVACGTMICEALAAAELLESRGVSAKVVKLNVITPASVTALAQSLAGDRAVLTAEEVCAAGCIGVRLLAELEKLGDAPKSRLLNLGAGIVAHGSIDELRAKHGIDSASIADAAEQLAGGRQ